MPYACAHSLSTKSGQGMTMKHQTLTTFNALICLSGLLVLVASCDQISAPNTTKAKPYTTKNFELIANTGHTRPVVVVPLDPKWATYPQGKRMDVDDRDFIPALKALVPVQDTTNYQCGFDLVLMYDSRDITMIWVKYHGKELIYRLEEFSYVGGDAEKMRSAMEKIGGPVPPK